MYDCLSQPSKLKLTRCVQRALKYGPGLDLGAASRGHGLALVSFATVLIRDALGGMQVPSITLILTATYRMPSLSLRCDIQERRRRQEIPMLHLVHSSSMNFQF